jgi:hypothetical protein
MMAYQRVGVPSSGPVSPDPPVEGTSMPSGAKAWPNTSHDPALA